VSRHPWLVFVGVTAVILATYLATAVATEPFFNGDETRHVVTGVFVRDAIRDGGYRHPRAYAEQFYAQYPALGLIAYPPGFYAIEGMVMSVFGPTFTTARAVEYGYFVLAAAYLFALARRTHGLLVAAVATLLYGVSRDVFYHTRAVMLETPLTACGLGALFHLERFLTGGRRRDLALVGFWTVAAGLHRYDAVFLAPTFALRLAFAGRLPLLLRRDVLMTGTVTILALAPVYLLAYAQIGSTVAKTPVDEMPLWWKVTYYPSMVWFQLGHLGAVAAGIGFVRTFRRDRWAAAAPYWALAAGVYATMTPLGELTSSRHTIPWVPALCVFAAEAMTSPARAGRPWLAALFATAVLGQSAHWTLDTPPPYVRGYRPAAEFVVAHSTGTCVVLFDGLLDGTFVYEVLSADPDRRVWVARGDKLLYAVRCDPGTEYVEWAKGEDDILQLISELDPDFIVVEDPPAKYEVPMAKILRSVLANHPDRFTVVAENQIEQGNLDWLENRRLITYRCTRQDPTRPRELRLKMLWQGTELKAAVK
jgi:hypothetical protein